MITVNRKCIDFFPILTFFFEEFRTNRISLNQLLIEDVANYARRVNSITKSDNIIITSLAVKKPFSQIS